MRNALYVIAGLVVLACAALLAGISPHAQETTTNTDDRPYIVTTTAQIADVVRAVAGDTARVESLMGEGIDPHLYRPTRTDIMKLKRANIVFYNGLHLEGQMVELMETLSDEKPVFAVSTFLPTEDLIDGSTGHDPHIWMDAGNWIAVSVGTARSLSSIHAEHTGLYQTNANQYAARLKALDQYIRSSFANISPERRILVTAHDAFAYLGKAYGMEVVGIQGISTESEAGLRKIEDIVNLLVERKVPAVFIESSVSDRNVKALIEGAAAQGHNVVIGGTLYSDAMGASGTYEGTYIGMMDHNATAISHALGAQVPENGMNGQLAAN